MKIVPSQPIEFYSVTSSADWFILYWPAPDPNVLVMDVFFELVAMATGVDLTI